MAEMIIVIQALSMKSLHRQDQIPLPFRDSYVTLSISFLFKCGHHTVLRFISDLRIVCTVVMHSGITKTQSRWEKNTKMEKKSNQLFILKKWWRRMPGGNKQLQI